MSIGGGIHEPPLCIDYEQLVLGVSFAEQSPSSKDVNITHDTSTFKVVDCRIERPLETFDINKANVVVKNIMNLDPPIPPINYPCLNMNCKNMPIGGVDLYDIYDIRRTFFCSMVYCCNMQRLRDCGKEMFTRICLVDPSLGKQILESMTIARLNYYLLNTPRKGNDISSFFLWARKNIRLIERYLLSTTDMQSEEIRTHVEEFSTIPYSDALSDLMSQSDVDKINNELEKFIDRIEDRYEKESRRGERSVWYRWIVLYSYIIKCICEIEDCRIYTRPITAVNTFYELVHRAMKIRTGAPNQRDNEIRAHCPSFFTNLCDLAHRHNLF